MSEFVNLPLVITSVRSALDATRRSCVTMTVAACEEGGLDAVGERGVGGRRRGVRAARGWGRPAGRVQGRASAMSIIVFSWRLEALEGFLYRQG